MKNPFKRRTSGGKVLVPLKSSTGGLTIPRDNEVWPLPPKQKLYMEIVNNPKYECSDDFFETHKKTWKKDNEECVVISVHNAMVIAKSKKAELALISGNEECLELFGDELGGERIE